MKSNLKLILYIALTIFILLLIYLIYKEYTKENFYRRIFSFGRSGGIGGFAGDGSISNTFGINPAYIDPTSQATITKILATKTINPDAPVNVKPAVYSNTPDLTMSSKWFQVFLKKNAAANKLKDRFLVQYDTDLWILHDPDQYFTLSNQQTGLCITGEKDGNNMALRYRNCGTDNNKFKVDANGIIKTPDNLCFAADYNGDVNGRQLSLSPQYCDQPFDFLSNGALRHRSSGRCIHPNGGVANDGAGLVTWDDCNAGSRINVNKNNLPKGNSQYLGHIDDAHVGQIRMKDGTWLSIQDAFTLIVGPGQKEGFRFTPTSNSDDYYSYSSALYPYTPLQLSLSTHAEHFRYDFLGIGGWVSGAANTLANEATSLADKIASGTVTAAEWTAARASDAANFAKNAANSVGSWATTISGDALNWAKNAGNAIVHDLVSIGNSIGNFARNTFNDIVKTAETAINDIANFFGDLAGKAKEFVTTAVNYINSNIISQVPGIWSKYIQPVLGTAVNLALQGSLCDYYVSLQLSKLDAIQAIEPALLPIIGEALVQLIKDTLETAALATVALAPFVPMIELIYPFIDGPIQDQVQPLLTNLVETDFMVNQLTTLFNPVVNELSKTTCDFLLPPDDVDQSI